VTRSLRRLWPSWRAHLSWRNWRQASELPLTRLAKRWTGPNSGTFAVRTRYFDDRLIAALQDGIRQVVSLAAGMDGRAMRLECPPGTRWYEVDMPEMVAFKEALMARAGMAPTCHWSGIGADLVADWYSELQEAGFDRRQPSAWLIEGLLMYLTEEVADDMLAEVTRASAPGSWLLVEHLDTRMLGEGGRTVQDAVKSQNSVMISARDDVADWLAGYGWRASLHAGSDPEIGYGRVLPEMPAGWLACAVQGSGPYPPLVGTTRNSRQAAQILPLRDSPRRLA